jgi:hypothetical protein
MISTYQNDLKTHKKKLKLQNKKKYIKNMVGQQCQIILKKNH